MRIPYTNFKEARERADHMAAFVGLPAYVNRLASSGIMQYEASTEPITDTSFGGGVVHIALPPAKEKK